MTCKHDNQDFEIIIRCSDCKEIVSEADLVKATSASVVPVSNTPALLIGLNTITQGDCLDLLPRVASGSVDMVLCDLPYGTTAYKWDSVIPFGPSVGTVHSAS